ncbi:FUSC family protein [Streptomyces sp. NPDC091266]|uniref:FUSC family protein n=1 Tax=Streptomyces sp. NPDC091266 TaxID=3365978 RepID=UPI003802F11A
MGKHAKPSGKGRPAGETGETGERGTTAFTGAVRARPLPLRSTVRLRRPVDIWHKPALSAVVALGIPDVTLLLLDRLDLILYTSAGAMCALYAHGLPYAARARTLPWVVLGMVAGLGVALTAASLTTSTVLLVVLASLLAAVHKTVCDATRIGPPGNLILTFIAASAFFVPQQIGQVPLHLALALGTGALAWLVCMAPSLVRPQGPERIATARALEAAAGLLRAEAEAESEAEAEAEADGAEPAGIAQAGVALARIAQARHTAAAAVNTAWHTLFLVPARTPEKAAARGGLERLLVRAESAWGGAGAGGERVNGQGAGAEAERLTGWARELRRGRALPEVTLSVAQADELAGIAVEAAATESASTETAHTGTDSAGAWSVGTASVGTVSSEGVGAEAAGARPSGPQVVGGAGVLRRPAPGRPRGLRVLRARLAPGSPLLPIGARVALGCVLAGWASMAVGVGHPYWAVVTAASIYQANTTLSWQRALQRTLGNLLGLVLFGALLPLIHTGPVAMVGLALVFQLGAEAWITRNYWLGSVCVTPMALLLTAFGTHLPARTLIADRWIDTVVGAAVGMACCVLVTNRRATDRIDSALERVVAAESAAHRLLAAGPAPGAEGVRETGWARDRLAGCLVELREAVDVAAGEWWQRALPEERIALAEQRGHRALSGLVGSGVTSAPAA